MTTCSKPPSGSRITPSPVPSWHQIHRWCHSMHAGREPTATVRYQRSKKRFGPTPHTAATMLSSTSYSSISTRPGTKNSTTNSPWSKRSRPSLVPDNSPARPSTPLDQPCHERAGRNQPTPIHRAGLPVQVPPRPPPSVSDRWQTPRCQLGRLLCERSLSHRLSSIRLRFVASPATRTYPTCLLGLA